jgi:hypothetical protein
MLQSAKCGADIRSPPHPQQTKKTTKLYDCQNLPRVALVTRGHQFIKNDWCHLKAYFNPCNRHDNCIYHLAYYMLAARCKAEKVDQFTKFIRFVATIDWIPPPPGQKGPGHK